MFRWKLMLRSIFGLRRQQPKARRLRRTVRPHLEVLEDRTLLAGMGAVFVSTNNGTVNEYTATGTLVQTLSDGIGGYRYGMALDSSGRLYVTNFSASNISRFTTAGTVDTPNPYASGDPNSDNESIVFDNYGDFYVGQADGTHNILKFNAAGAFLARYNVATENRGSDWIALAPDQATMYYVSEGKTVLGFNVATNTQLSNFAANLPGSYAYEIQLLPDGGMLVADTQEVVRLDSAGNVVNTYLYSSSNEWFAVALASDGQSFWAGDYYSGNVVQVDLATGATLNSFNVSGGAGGLLAAPPISTTTVADASVVEPAPGQPVTLLATVAGLVPGNATPTGTVTFTEGSTTYGTATLQNGVAQLALPDGLALGTHTITAAYNGDVAFTPSQGNVTLSVKDPPDDKSGCNCNCGCPNEPGDIVAEPADEGAPVPDESIDDPVRYADGVVTIAETDLHSDGFGYPWGQTRSWSNGGGYSNGLNGNGWVDTYTPDQLIRADGSTTNSLIVAANGTTAYYFNLVNGVYQASNGEQSQLIYNNSNDTYTLIDGVGDQIVFDGFGSTWLPAQRGQFASYTNADGVKMTATDNSNGQITQLQRSAGGVTEKWVYSYLPSTDRNAGLLSNVELLNNSGAIVRQVQYVYYDGTQQYGGNLGDLMTATIEDASANPISTDYYRYYTAGDPNGYKHGLKYVFNGESYGRLTWALGTTLSSLTDAQVAPYADNYFQYDSNQRVTEEVAAGAGAASPVSFPSGGLGTFTFSYTASSNTPGYNSWNMKTVVTNPDGSTDTVYTNAYAQVMLDDHYDPTSNLDFDTFYVYNSNGQVILTAEPSAVSGYSDTYADLLHNVNGSYQYLNNNSGLITRYDYYTTTNANDKTAGGVANYLQDKQIQQGQQGALIPQETWQYYAHIVNGQTIAPIATDTVYRNNDGTGGETTSYSYSWYANTAQIQSETDTAPVISAAENGPGTPDVTTTFYDAYGNVQWVKDPSGFIHYYAYDTATGAQVEQIDDVNTNSAPPGLPSGWTTPNWGNGGANLVTTDAVDGLGRTTKETSPGGNITYYVYLDTQQEERIYRGWNSTTGTPTLPTEVIDDYRGLYTETLTMTAAPSVTNGAPDGSEAISGLQSLTRDYYNDAGQVLHQYAYFNLNGLGYATVPFGTRDTNYYETDYVYDSGGRLFQTETDNGTWYRTIYNSLGEAVSDWVATAPTPWVQTAAYTYDNGGVGDGNLTQVTDMPGLGAANRVTDYWYDWRDRLVAEKDGVETNETDGVNRPIIVTTYDNLDEVTETQQYLGDGVTPTISGGVLQALPSANLRAQEVDNYDDQGRLYKALVYDVNPSTGAVSTSALTTNYYYDHRGNLMAESDPGGLWTKTYVDGAGRAYEVFTTDGASGTTWGGAADVTNDNVLEQEQSVYDADNNVIETIDSQRFHNTSGVGHLGTPTTGVLARVYYAASYYDNVDRLIDSVDAGTNNGTAWTRPSTAPSSSSATLLLSQFQYTYTATGLVEDVIDPMGIKNRTYYDNLGRVTKTVQNFTGGTPGAEIDVTTEYGYDGNDNVTYVQADEPGGAYQKTAYIYGVTTTAGDGANSNDILSAIQHPDPSTGNPSSSQQDSYLTNALGQVVQSSDRNGSVHQYSYDVLGRITSDNVSTLGTGVDGTVRQITYGYDSQGNNNLTTSLNGGGSIVNQVQRVYNGLGQLTGEYQSHSGAVVQGTTPEVQYGYTEMSGGQNNSRLTSMSYPSGYLLNFNYNAGMDSNISRLSSISDSANTLESYKYLGLATVVERDHPQTNVNLSYIHESGDNQANNDGGDQYTGLDRFGRVIDQNWVNPTTGISTDRYQYGYNQDSDVLYRQNLVDAVMSELYTYDNLNQLSSFQRGTLNSTKNGIVGTPSRSQNWTPDALGNFTGVTTNGTAQTRTANQQNEYTSISGSGTITYDANGNITADGSGNTFVYDAWNRLVAVKNGTTTLAAYTYDGINRRSTETHGSTTTDLYYSANWQVLEERNNGQLQARYVWSPAGVDALVLRDDSSQNNGVLDRRLYVQQDSLGNVTALVDTSGNVVERDDYDPFGAVTVLNPDFSTRGTSSFNWIYLLQGKRYDGAAGLYGSRERDCSPTLMRWLQTDPLGQATGPNGYAAYGNQPTDMVDPSGLSPWDYITAVGQGLYEGVQNLGIGAKNTAVEMGQMARDLGNTVAAAGALATGNVYDYDLHSNTFGGFDRAVRQGQGDRFLLNAMGDGASLGLKPIGEGIWDYIQTGDATNASQICGGVAAANLAQASMMKFAPIIPLPSLRLPSLRLPSLRPPSLRMPSLRLPSLRLPGLRNPLSRLRGNCPDTTAPNRGNGGFSGHRGRGFNLNNDPLQPVRNSPATIGNRVFSGHALDQMQNRGIPPSVVENTIQHGTPFPGNSPGTQGFFDPLNRVRVIINSDNGTVVTVMHGG